MAVADTSSPTSGVSDWLLELAIGVVVIVLGGSVWAYTHFSGKNPHQNKPKPAWLAVPKVMAQMSDGRMVDIKINLQLSSENEASELKPHMPAFTALIQAAGVSTTHDDLQQEGGASRFGKAIRTSLNGYLEEQDLPERIKNVAFEELMLMP
ncbi:MAG TPA: flagellar basal body-associated FliL family protein [Aquabacterium sp.]|nr:flagellar basal body-associated FliL family protein [Aquabacterium sp.]